MVRPTRLPIAVLIAAAAAVVAIVGSMSVGAAQTTPLPGLTYKEAAFTVAGHDVSSGTATCDPGQSVVGGGFFVTEEATGATGATGLPGATGGTGAGATGSSGTAGATAPGATGATAPGATGVSGGPGATTAGATEGSGSDDEGVKGQDDGEGRPLKLFASHAVDGTSWEIEVKNPNHQSLEVTVQAICVGAVSSVTGATGTTTTGASGATTTGPTGTAATGATGATGTTP